MFRVQLSPPPFVPPFYFFGDNVQAHTNRPSLAARQVGFHPLGGGYPAIWQAEITVPAGAILDAVSDPAHAFGVIGWSGGDPRDLREYLHADHFRRLLDTTADDCQIFMFDAQDGYGVEYIYLRGEPIAHAEVAPYV